MQQRADDTCKEFATDEQREAAQDLIRLHGYDCKEVDADAMCPYILLTALEYTVMINTIATNKQTTTANGQLTPIRLGIIITGVRLSGCEWPIIA
jgi:hypothetical protein